MNNIYNHSKLFIAVDYEYKDLTLAKIKTELNQRFNRSQFAIIWEKSSKCWAIRYNPKTISKKELLAVPSVARIAGVKAENVDGKSRAIVRNSESLESIARNFGLVFNGFINTDGRYHATKTIDKPKGNPAGRYKVLHDGGKPYAIYLCNWRLNHSETVFIDRFVKRQDESKEERLTRLKHEAYLLQLAEDRKEQEQQQDEQDRLFTGVYFANLLSSMRSNLVAVELKDIKNQSSLNLNYILKKCLNTMKELLICTAPFESQGKLIAQSSDIIIPIYQDTKQGTIISGLQIISPEGSKRFVTGSKLKNSFHVLQVKGYGSYLPVLTIPIICEGIATGNSIRDLLEKMQLMHDYSDFFSRFRFLVVVAFNRGNLANIAKKYISANKPVILALDNDTDAQGSDDSLKLYQRLAELSNRVAMLYPTFNERNNGDWNDKLMELRAYSFQDKNKALEEFNSGFVTKFLTACDNLKLTTIGAN